MKTQWMVASCLALLLGTTSCARDKLAFAGKQRCAKPEVKLVLPVGDRPDHVLALVTATCTWTAGDVGGVQVKEEHDTYVSDVVGDTAHETGYAVGSFVNGDGYVATFDVTVSLEHNVPVRAAGTWTVTSGTGGMKDAKGQGLMKGTFNADGTSAFDYDGAFERR